MTKQIFELVKLAKKEDKNKKKQANKTQQYIDSSSNSDSLILSLQQIVMIQEDEPLQKSCIYKINKKSAARYS